MDADAAKGDIMSAHMQASLYESGIAAQPDGVVDQHYCYPGSLVLLPAGKLMAVFTAQCKAGPSRAVGIYSADGGRTWSPPVTLFGGPELCDSSIDPGEAYGDPNLVIVNDRRVMLFCVSLRHVRGALDLSRTRFWRRISEDGGETFGPVEELPRHRRYYVGTVHAGMRLRNGALVMGYSWDMRAENRDPADGEGAMDLVCGVLISRDEGLTWQPGGDLHARVSRGAQALKHATNGLDEPAVVELANGDLFMLARTCDSKLWQSFSHDAGQTWEPATPSALVSHNCPATLLRLAGDDAVLVIYNNHPQQRVRLSASVSTDRCRTWPDPRLLAPLDDPDQPEVSYPAACQLPDGTIVAVFGRIERSKPDAMFVIGCVRFSRTYLGT